MDEPWVAAYLARIGAERPARPDVAALHRLQRAHLGTVPFENLGIHLGEQLVLDEPALLAKIVERRRGGFCYELNGAFALLLTALGYRVTLLSARTFTDGLASPPMDHLALRVDLERPWLVDVGFGRFTHHPLRLDLRDEQHDAGGRYRIVEHGALGDLDVIGADGPEYRLDPRPYALGDFVPACWWQQTAPGSHFTRSLICSRLTPTGRITITGSTLVDTSGGARTERVLAQHEVLPAYEEHFGMKLDRVPVLRAHRTP